MFAAFRQSRAWATSHRRASTRRRRHRASRSESREIAWTPWTLKYLVQARARLVQARARLAEAKPLGKNLITPPPPHLLRDNGAPRFFPSDLRGASLSPRLTLKSICTLVHEPRTSRASFVAPRARHFTRRHPARVRPSSRFRPATKNEPPDPRPSAFPSGCILPPLRRRDGVFHAGWIRPARSRFRYARAPGDATGTPPLRQARAPRRLVVIPRRHPLPPGRDPAELSCSPRLPSLFSRSVHPKHEEHPV